MLTLEGQCTLATQNIYIYKTYTECMLIRHSCIYIPGGTTTCAYNYVYSITGQKIEEITITWQRVSTYSLHFVSM